MKEAVQKKSDKQDAKENRKQFKAFFRYSHLSWGWIAIAMGINMIYYLTVTKLPGSTAALFMGKFTKSAIMGVVTNYSLTLVMLVIVSVASLLAEAKSVRSVRKAVWKRMMGIETNYYNEHGANRLLSAVTSDTEIAVSTLMGVFVTLPGLIMYLAKALPTINSFSPKLLWAVIVMIPFYILYAIFMGRWQCKVGGRIQTKIGGLTGFLTDRIRNLTTIKAFVTEKAEEENGVNAAKELYKGNMEYAYLNSIMALYTILMDVAGTVIAVIWGCVLLKSGEINLESWLAFYLFAPTINTVLRQITMMWSNMKEVQGRTARIGALMAAPQEDMKSESAQEISKGDIRLQNVTFSYIENVPSIKDISFTIPEGKTTAIVGNSGSGKTTILRLLEKLYVPQEGSITIGKADLNDLNLHSWRDRISYVNQGAEIFSGSIREALTYGVHREVTDEELQNAAKLAGIYDFIMAQPNGYNEELAIWGSAMSGGQRQRMVIAREILKNADILLLDEPTSALDSETAASVTDTFFHGFSGKTIISVTHEIGFITNADQIIVLSEGQVEASGTHEELMETCSMYRKLVEEQSYQEVFS